MAYGTPTDPVAGTVITVNYAVANILNPIRWLRALTGNADPPGTGYMVTSDSTSATTWKTGVAAILSVLGYTPVNKAGDTGVGPLGVSLLAVQQTAPTASGVEIGRTAVADTPFIDLHASGGAVDYDVRLIATGGSGTPGTGTLGVFAALLACLGQISGSTLKSTVATGTAPLDITSTTVVPNLNASTVAGRAPGTSAGDLAFYDGGGRVAIAAVADNAGDSNTVASKAPGTTAGTLAFYDGSGKVVAAVTADVAANAALLDSIDSTGFQLEVTPLSAAPSGVTVTGSSVDISGSTLTLAGVGKWLVTAKCIVVHGASDLVAVRMMTGASTVVDQTQSLSTAGGTQTVGLVALVTSGGSTTVKLNTQKLAGASTSTLSAIVITAAYVSR